MSISDVFSFIAKEFPKENIPCLLVGGIAVAAYRPARNTTDIDFLIDEKDAEKAIQCLKKLGYAPFLKTESVVRLEPENKSYFIVDLLLVDKNTFDLMMADGKKFKVGNTEYFIPSANHLIAMKLHAMKNNKNREFKDILDVAEIIKQNNIDTASDEFKNLCLKFGTEDLYNKIHHVFKK